MGYIAKAHIKVKICDFQILIIQGVPREHVLCLSGEGYDNR